MSPDELRRRFSHVMSAEAADVTAPDSCSDGVVQEVVEDRTVPVTPRAIERARCREDQPWRRIGSFDLSEFADRF